MLYAVIMAGGSGTRLWPLSRKQQPKQALKLIGDETMFQHAVSRLEPLFTPDRIYCVTSPLMAEVLRPQTPHVPEGNFILEPAGRDSAPAAGLAAAYLLKRDPDAVMVMLTADHFISDADGFRNALAAAAEVAEDGSIVTLGIRPDHPATGFGYIALGEAETIMAGYRVYQSAGFTEKPDHATAQRFLEEGRHVWNSGMFVWRADRLMAEFAAQLPELHAALEQIGWAIGGPEEPTVLREVWAGVKKVSIDYGIMEHAERVAVVPIEIGWSDVGSWASLLDILSGDEQGNVLSGEVIAVDSHNCLVRAGDQLVATLGLENIIIVSTPGALLVCTRDRAQDVKEIVNRLAEAGKTNHL